MNSNLDDFLRLLQSERRRIVLGVLSDLQREQGTETVSVRVEDLSRQVAAIESETDSVAVGEQARQSSTVGLHHTHLPMLAAHGVIEYDTESDTVSTTDRTRSVAQTMRDVVETIEESDMMVVR